MFIVTTIGRWGTEMDYFEAEKSTGICDAPECAVPALLEGEQEETEGLQLTMPDEESGITDLTHVCWKCLGGKGFRVSEI